jgi:hypothetical protein
MARVLACVVAALLLVAVAGAHAQYLVGFANRDISPTQAQARGVHFYSLTQRQQHTRTRTHNGIST